MLWAGMIRKGHPQIPGHGLVARPERMGRPELHFLPSPLAFQTLGEQECGPSREICFGLAISTSFLQLT